MAKAEDIQLSAKLWEWVDSGLSGNVQAVRNGTNRAAKRTKKGQRDVTFRLAMDL